MNKQWQDDLRDRIKMHEEPTPEGLWDDIEQSLLVENNVHFRPSKHRIPLWVARSAAVAAVALGLLIIGFYFLNDDGGELHVAEQNYPEKPVSDTSPAVTEPTTKTKPTTKTEPITRTEPIVKTESPLLASAAIKSKTVVTDNSPTTSDSDERQQQQPGDEGHQDSIRTTDTPELQLTMTRHNHRPSKWQTDLYASNMPSGSTSSYNGYGSFVPYELNTEEFALASAMRSELPNDIRGLKEYQHVYTDIKHSQPVTLGVSVKYNLNDRWSLTSGLTYTLLSSELRSGSKTDNHYHHSRQKLHYVGIPLNVNYTVWRNNRFSSYVSGGGLVEKNVSGKLTTDFVIGDQLETQNRQDIRVKPLQWSVNSAVGFQYRVAKTIGLYAEPGVTYHFKNSSEVETIYKDNPFNVNIRLGLRFSLNE